MLNGDRKAKFDKIKQHKNYKSVKLVSIGDLPAIIKNNELSFTLPGKSGRITALAKRVEATSKTEYLWEGELTNAEGYMMIMAKEGRVFGYINVGKEMFEIQDLGDGHNILVEIDRPQLKNKVCAVSSKGKPIDIDDPKGGFGRMVTTTRERVRVLILYNPDADNAVANINDYASLAMQQTNSALNNSGISGNLTFVLAGVEPWSHTYEPTNITNEKNALIASSHAELIRDQFEADVVVLLTDGNYDDFGDSVIGPIRRDAYAIVKVTAPSGRYTFAHEVGHLFGCQHDDASGIIARGHSFKTGWWPFRTTRRTILNFAYAEDPKILHYSNPDVRYSNKPTGKSDRNNARQLREQAATVAAFRATTPPFSVSFTSGRTLIGEYDYGNQTYTVSASNGTQPYTYRWCLSSDGFNYSCDAITSNTSKTYNFVADGNTTRMIKVTGYDAVGNSRVEYLHIYIEQPDNGEPLSVDGSGGGFEFEDNKLINEENSLIVLYPNPSNNQINLKLQSTKEQSIIEYSMVNLNGEQVVSGQFLKESTSNQNLEIDVSKIPLGQYILHVQSGAINVTKHIIINK